MRASLGSTKRSMTEASAEHSPRIALRRSAWPGRSQERTPTRRKCGSWAVMGPEVMGPAPGAEQALRVKELWEGGGIALPPPSDAPGRIADRFSPDAFRRASLTFYSVFAAVDGCAAHRPLMLSSRLPHATIAEFPSSLPAGR